MFQSFPSCNFPDIYAVLTEQRGIFVSSLGSVEEQNQVINYLE